MSTKTVARPEAAKIVPITKKINSFSELLRQYGDPMRMNGNEGALYERHLIFDRAIDPKVASARERFEAFAHSVRDVLGTTLGGANQGYLRAAESETHLLLIYGVPPRTLPGQQHHQSTA
jgi:hypothetical protein